MTPGLWELQTIQNNLLIVVAKSVALYVRTYLIHVRIAYTTQNVMYERYYVQRMYGRRTRRKTASFVNIGKSAKELLKHLNHLRCGSPSMYDAKIHSWMRSAKICFQKCVLRISKRPLRTESGKIRPPTIHTHIIRPYFSRCKSQRFWKVQHLYIPPQIQFII